MQSAEHNRQWRVAAYPEPGELISSRHFEWATNPIETPRDEEFLVRTVCLATGPAQRGYLQAEPSPFLGQVPVGEVMRGRGVGQIIESHHPDYRRGDIFVGSLGWQDYSVQKPRGAEFVFSTKKVAEPMRPLSAELGLLGQAGATAYFGLHEAGDLRTNDRVLISAAAGGVGSVAGQIARLRGAKQVVGIAGSAGKCQWLVDELGFSAAINYRDDDVDRRLGELFPEGIDLFFDNVGGELLDTALNHLALGARVALCGFIATDYAAGPQAGPINYRNLVARRARMQGFVVFDYWERYGEAEQQLRRWYRDGQLKNCEDVAEGLEHMPAALASLFTGANRGIKLCQVAPDPEGLPRLEAATA